MIKSKPGKQFAAASQALCLQVLTDDPGDNTYGHTPLHIQTGDGKRYIVLFAGHPVVIAGVGYRIDAIGEAHIDNPAASVTIRRKNCRFFIPIHTYTRIIHGHIGFCQAV